MRIRTRQILVKEWDPEQKQYVWDYTAVRYCSEGGEDTYSSMCLTGVRCGWGDTYMHTRTIHTCIYTLRTVCVCMCAYMHTHPPHIWCIHANTCSSQIMIRAYTPSSHTLTLCASSDSSIPARTHVCTHTYTSVAVSVSVWAGVERILLGRPWTVHRNRRGNLVSWCDLRDC